MEYTKRQKAIILYLSNKQKLSPSKIPGKQIANHLQISLRTLQNEIASINHSSRITIIDSTNRGYSLSPNAITSLHLSPQLQDDDKMQILKCLLLEKGPFYLEDLEERFFLSTSAFMNKLKKINEALAEYQLTLSEYQLEIKREKNQIYIAGTEYQIRRLIHDMIMREIGLTYDGLEIVSNYFKNINTVEIQAIILSAIHKHNYYIESCYTTNLVINILTAFSRIDRHYQVEEVYVPDHENLPEYQIAKDICADAALHFSMNFQEQDILYVTLLIMGQIKPLTEKPLLNAAQKEEADQIVRIINRTFQNYMLNIDYNSYLPNFVRHIQSLIVRARNQQLVINLISENIRETSPFVYDVAVHLAKTLEDIFQISIIDEEIGLLSIYIGFIIEQSMSSADKIKVLIVCNNYKNMAQNLLQRLKETFPDVIEITDIILHTPPASKYAQADLIVHTMPIPKSGKNSILISPFFTAEDQRKIAENIAKLQKKKEVKQNQELLKSYFNEHLYFRNIGLQTKNKVLNFLGQKVEEIGLCDSGFTQSVLKRESMSSTCFMNSFAIPHALELNASRTCFAVLIDEKGISWDDCFIHCVFMIAVCREDRKEFMKIYSAIIQYLLQENAIRQLIEAPDFKKFIACFHPSNQRGEI